MTTDAKVGLLLGLVFIVIIAFVINGLPDFVGKFKDKPVVETAVTTQTGGNLVIEPAVVDVARSLQQGHSSMRYVETPAETANLELSAGGNQATETIAADAQPSANEPQPSFSNTTVSPQDSPALILPQVQQDQQQSAPRSPQLTQTQQAARDAVSQVDPAPAKTDIIKSPTIPGKTHMVREGESLGSIAKKYYGSQLGNQRATIQMIYEANKSVLDSPNKVKIGDQLIIPKLAESPAQIAQPVPPKQPESKTLMDKFKDVFVDTEKKPEAAAKSDTESEKPKTASADKKMEPKKLDVVAKKSRVEDKPEVIAVPKSVETKKAIVPAKVKLATGGSTTEYTIQNGDNPYKIAEKMLGNGDRYPEILTLNRSQIKNPSKLVVGTKIKIPSR